MVKRFRARSNALVALALVGMFALVGDAAPPPPGPVPGVGLFYTMTSDPTTGAGYAAPLWQIGYRTDISPTQFCFKFGTANTAWVCSSLGAGSGTVSGSGTPPDIAAWTGANALGNYAGSTCAAGSAATGLSAAGAVTCAILGTITGSGTSPDLAEWTAGSAIGNYAGSACAAGSAATGLSGSGAVACASVVGGTGTAPDLAIFTATGAIGNYAGSGCGAGSAVTSLTGSGQATCGLLGTGTVTSSGSPSANQTPVFSSATNIIPGTTTDNGTTFKVGNFARTDTLDSSSTGTINNYALGATTTWLDLSGAGTSTTISGFTGGVDGRELYVTNTNASNGIQFLNENASSTAANRLTLSGSTNWSLNNPLNQTIHLIYDGNTSRWRNVITSYFYSTVVTQALSSTSGTFSSTLLTNGSIAIANISARTDTGTVDNLSLGNVTVVRWTGASSVIFDGFIPTAQNLVYIVINASTTANVSLTLANEASGSTAANRIQGVANANVVLPGSSANQSGAAIIWYDLTTARWRTLSYTDAANNNAPTPTSCGSGATAVGSTAMNGKLMAGTVTEGTGATGCIVTWVGTTCSAAADCTYQDNTSGIAVTATTSTTALTITNVGAASSTPISYNCMCH